TDGSSADLIFHNWNPLQAFTVSSVIADNNTAARAVNLIQTGDGTTALSGANTYTGITFVHGGVLRLDSVLALPGGTEMRLDGGVIGLNSGDFTRANGNAGSQVSWKGSGGFAAYTTQRTVNLGGSSAVLTWGAGAFVRDNDSLILGAQDADATLVFANPVDLGRKSRMVEVTSGRGPAALTDARFSGVLSGDGGDLVKGGLGTLELTASNAYSGGTFLAEGRLVGTNSNAFGSGLISVATTTDTRSAGTAIVLEQRASTLTNNLSFGNSNADGISVLRGSATLATVSGGIAIDRVRGANVIIDLPAVATTTLSGPVSGTGGILLTGGGTVVLTGANSYGSAAGISGAAVDSATIIRSGSVHVGSTGALSGGVIELGDATHPLAGVVHATDGQSVLGVERTAAFTANNRSSLGGVFNPDGNGTVDGGGFANAGTGAFYNVNPVIAGRTFNSGDINSRILVKDEALHPERNGIYTIVGFNADGTMNLSRSTDFDSAAEMLRGATVTVSSGSAAGAYFMAAPDITSVNATGTNPVHWLPDTLNPGVTLRVTNPAVTSLSQAIEIQANGTGLTTIAAANPVSFGSVTLQDVRTGVAEVKTLHLDSTASGLGMTFSQAIQETSANDTLSITKIGAGTATFSAANTYKGLTTVSTGVLLANNASGGSATGLGSVLVEGGATLGGTGHLAPAPGNGITINNTGILTVGHVGNLTGETLDINLGTGSALLVNGTV
ncbi:MAG: autotransporter-associated beta strand repeat-containing protein, partial [Verrucomicrobiaceae bacterium]|nr:autotransporter-associated beta strand repeat-containing protein [Verrucomicrobiaceae bacterium]